LPSRNQRPFLKSMNASTSLENICDKTAHSKQHNITNIDAAKVCNSDFLIAFNYRFLSQFWP
jgi:hypothetical protein